MRNLLFYAELKSKRLAKIKSKAYHRIANKAAARRAAKQGAEEEGDDQAARKAAEEIEFERAKVCAGMPSADSLSCLLWSLPDCLP